MVDEASKTDTPAGSDKPLVFISHDSRDAELAEAFSSLVNKSSMGMLKAFRSSDTRGVEGIEFGSEWYTRVMGGLCVATDVVCLFTERSIGRPWILFEAGVAKGKLDRPVFGIALGIELSKVSTGPFFQFQNCGDDEDSLAKLITQLCKRIPGAEPNEDVIRMLVRDFRGAVAGVIEKDKAVEKVKVKTSPEEAGLAKILEEMKMMIRELPRYVESSSIENRRVNPQFLKRFNPDLLRNVCHKYTECGSVSAVVVAAGMVRDEFPWFYDLVLTYYRAAVSGDRRLASYVIKDIRAAVDVEMVVASSRTEKFDGYYFVLKELMYFVERTNSEYKMNVPRSGLYAGRNKGVQGEKPSMGEEGA